MIHKNTVFVLGAGASYPYGFPLGVKLRQDIMKVPATYLHDVKFLDRPKPSAVEPSTTEFFQAFIESKAPSIDAFLANRMEFAEIGRIAIAKVLLGYEVVHRLFDDANDDDWYAAVFNAIRCPREHLGSNKVSFVTFNYDRSLELALWSFLRHTYKLTDDEAWTATAQFPIVHVYGSLGSLNPQSQNFVPYGLGGLRDSGISSADEQHRQRLVTKAAAQIRVIPEHRGDQHSEGFDRAKKIISEAERLVFLGFAFDDLNVTRLSPDLQGAMNAIVDALDGDAPRFAGTVFGLRDAEIRRVAKLITPASKRLSTMQGLHAMRSTDMLRHTGIHICD